MPVAGSQALGNGGLPFVPGVQMPFEPSVVVGSGFDVRSFCSARIGEPSTS